MRRVLIIILPLAALAALALPLLFTPTRPDTAPADLANYARYLNGTRPDLDITGIEQRVIKTTNSVGNTYIAQQDHNGACWALRVNPPDPAPRRTEPTFCEPRTAP